MAGDLVEVELDDELDAPARPRRRSRPPRRWTPRVWGRLAAALAVLLAVGVVLDGLHAPGLLPAANGLVADLRVARHEGWRATGTLLGAAGDVVVVEDPSARVVTGRRLADGAVAWTAAGLAACSLVGLADDAPSASLVHPADRARVVCRPAGPGSGGTSEDEQGVVVLDPVDGRVVLREAGAGGAGGWATVGRHLVVLTGGPDARIGARSLEDGTALWSAPVDADLVAAGWFVAGDWLVLGVDGAAYHLGTGERRDPHGLEATARTVLPGGTVLTMHWGPEGSGVRTEARDAVGTRLWSVPAYAFVPPLVVDAGVVPLATADGGLEARDALTGDLLWSAPVEGPLVGQVGGVLVELSYDVSRLGTSDAENLVGGTTALVGLDLATGDELWHLRAAGADLMGTPALVSDGTRFALPDPAGGGVEVRDLRTAAVVARWPDDEGVASMLAVLPHGAVARVTSTGVVVLVP